MPQRGNLARHSLLIVRHSLLIVRHSLALLRHSPKIIPQYGGIMPQQEPSLRYSPGFELHEGEEMHHPLDNEAAAGQEMPQEAAILRHQERLSLHSLHGKPPMGATLR